MKADLPSSPIAITTQDYWESAWAHADVPDPIDPGDNRPENHFFQIVHSQLSRVIGNHHSPDAQLIELGCGGSRWLPYFQRAFGFGVSGIDYTVAGIRLSQAILDRAGVAGRIVQGDLFEPPPDWINHFDVVASFGLVEHFEDTAQIICACARYLRPGGCMITLVPTMRGLYGMAYRLLRPAVYRKHIPQSQKQLTKAHTDAGLNVIHSAYILGLPGIISAPAGAGFAARMTFAASRMYWRLERSGWGVPPNRWSSPFALCVATKPCEERGSPL